MSGADDPKSAFINASLWHGSLEQSEAILAAHPEIASSDIHTAAILGDDAAVRRFLELDPVNATAKGGPRGWDALTHLCFSKYLRLDPARSDGFVRAATALLDAGASANTGFWEENHQPKPEWESVLYGAAGVAHHPEMTRLLVERGADPNDGEVAYHSPETLDNRALKILVESGKLTPDSLGLMLLRKFNWHNDEGVEWLLDQGADANLLSWGGRPLHHALRFDCPIHYFEMLLDHGANPKLEDKDGATVFAKAARLGRADVLDLLERRGFPISLEGDDAFLAACARGNEASARQFADADPTLVERLQAQNPGMLVDFAGAGNTRAVAILLDSGFSPASARTQPRWVAGETGLHVATMRGRLDTAKLLIERGAPLEAKRAGGMTPLSVAMRCLIEQSEFTPNEYTIPIGEALLKAGAQIDAAHLTLTAAICLGLTAEVERLAREAGPKDRQMALAAAAFNGIPKAIANLIAMGADVNGENQGLNPNATPLHNAVCSGSLQAVQMIVDAGAQLDARDGSFRATPLAWAEYYAAESKTPKQYAEIVAWLKEKGATR